MDERKLGRISQRHSKLRGASRKPRELESLAKALGRRLANRGKHPTWVSDPFQTLRPVSIPHHSKDILPRVVESILDGLEMDIWAWREELNKEKQKASVAKQ
jgi:hypothetical protein